jgi:large subunit ribosomal protein L24e
MDCNFCEKKINKGTDFIFVTKKGKALYFCSSKCKRNMLSLDRKPRKTRWTKAYRIEKEARLKLLEHKEKPQTKKKENIESGKEPVKEKVKSKTEIAKGKTVSKSSKEKIPKAKDSDAAGAKSDESGEKKPKAKDSDGKPDGVPPKKDSLKANEKPEE